MDRIDAYKLINAWDCHQPTVKNLPAAGNPVRSGDRDRRLRRASLNSSVR
jgi:hypothetical protein